ncbi:MAG: hypothetical protein BroJett004_08230 [Planctomycetota bacterium]|nr:MAG: hypothetical protein BroJett004_08230 [Planctomycetota bacterium]
MLSLAPGVVIVVRNRETGLTRLACVDTVTKSGRVVAWWPSRMRAKRGTRTKPATLNPDRDQVVRVATPDERAHFFSVVDAVKPGGYDPRPGEVVVLRAHRRVPETLVLCVGSSARGVKVRVHRSGREITVPIDRVLRRATDEERRYWFVEREP